MGTMAKMLKCTGVTRALEDRFNHEGKIKERNEEAKPFTMCGKAITCFGKDPKTWSWVRMIVGAYNAFGKFISNLSSSTDAM